MARTIPCFVLILLGGVSLPVTGAAGMDRSGVTFGVTGGTLGIGLQAAYAFNSHFAVRGVAAALNVSTDFETGDLQYPVNAELRNAGVLLDYRPWGGNFRFTAGMYVNDNVLTGDAVCHHAGGCSIDDDSFNELSQGDEATGRASFNSVAPYVGIGWGRAPRSGGWQLHLDLGVMYLGNPEADVEVQELAPRGVPLPPVLGGGTHVNTAAAEAQVADEVEDKLADFSLYPVVMVGLGYRF